MSSKKPNDANEKKRSSLNLLFVNLFGGRKMKEDIFKEEDIQSPFKTVVSTYKDNKVSMIALIVFIAIFATVIIGPVFKPIDLSFSETTQRNVEPGLDMMKVPDRLKGNIRDIGIGPTFSVGVSNDGEVFIWGKTRVSEVLNIRNLPRDKQTNQLIDMGKIEKVAAGTDHVVAINEDGELFGWGSNRHMQLNLPEYNIGVVKDIIAGNQATILLTEDGYSHFIGNSNNNDYNEFHEYQGQLDQIGVTGDAVFGLTFDGDVVYLGFQQNSYSRVPENMGEIVSIAATASSMAAVNDQGQVFVWGNMSRNGEGRPPETDSKIVSLQGGRYHYSAILEDGSVVAWGGDSYDQSTVPSKLQNTNIETLYAGYYQNYAISEDGEVTTWGLKGYTLGSDELGRDIFTRLLNGGRMSMTIGAVAVIISTVIGVIVGSISGFFGGRIDMFLQRVSEMVSSLPFLPFAMILSALIGNALPSDQKIFVFMMVLGFLSWPSLQRLVRAQVLSVREQEYVIAARAVGVKKSAIVFKHILPNVISVIIVNATLSFASSMLTEATLSYLGFGVQAPQPTWGNMLYGANNSVVIQNYWWRWVFASIVLSVCVICINLIGDGLRDAIDPRSQER